MTISGPMMHRQLMDGYKGVQERLEHQRVSMQSIDSQRGELDDDRSDALVDLAEHYLPELTREAIQNSWIEVRSEVSRILMRKADHQRRVGQNLADASDQRSLQEDRLFELNESLDKADRHQQELAKQVESRLAADDAFSTLSTQAAAAEVALERAEANLSEIEQDAARKLPSYKDSALFQYLKDRQFGTSEYEKRGFTRRMDRWLAKFIDYRKAKQGYDFLIKTPEQMRKIIAEDRSALDTVMTELEQRRDEVADEVGLTKAIAEVEKLNQRHGEQMVQLESLRQQCETLQGELNDLQDTRGSYYREAVNAFRNMLSQFDSRDLASRARRTPTLTDDQIVARIVGVQEQLAHLDQDTRRQHQELQQLQGCLDAVGRLIQRFRAARFDGSRSTFLPTVDVVTELQRAETERDVEMLWDRLRQAQRWGPTLGEQMTQVATHPVTQVLISAMAQAAGAAMSEQARRAGRRRYPGSRRYRNAPWFTDSSGSNSGRMRW
ncbi:hypothetical protein FYK55_19205 [Roseiconus nitratireducens]|uniref:Uncharacterized protein n=1 Tax=Roseiconus nitratireducens TaxID=2605748 RepID=A0A5M6D0K2_9BACT|nr:hypothetical protein [Roseiconus nitratireducens]KAA5541028.1 hypothetical protein FYK55_19205 [Roseiconus nitratireducens]